MSWYSSPIEKGRIYRAKKYISELGHTFTVGEDVEFSGDSHDSENGVLRFWFKNTVTGDVKVWHVWENHKAVLDAWQDYFSTQ
jgi:hypothetical protein